MDFYGRKRKEGFYSLYLDPGFRLLCGYLLIKGDELVIVEVITFAKLLEDSIYHEED